LQVINTKLDQSTEEIGEIFEKNMKAFKKFLMPTKTLSSAKSRKHLESSPLKNLLEETSKSIQGTELKTYKTELKFRKDQQEINNEN
jgi:ribosomal protein S21